MLGWIAGLILLFIVDFITVINSILMQKISLYQLIC